jgi:hypothetical protein
MSGLASAIGSGARGAFGDGSRPQGLELMARCTRRCALRPSLSRWGQAERDRETGGEMA